MPNTNLPTNKIYVLISFNGIRTYLTEKEKDFFVQQLKLGKYIIEFDGEIYSANGLSIVKAEKLEMADKIKRGFWQCEQKHWNDRSLKRCDKCYY